MKKRIFNVVMTGALSLGVLGAASLPALAASDTALDSETKAKMINKKVLDAPGLFCFGKNLYTKRKKIGG
ncbi:hypothetical protein [Domibacillus iocasae]|uniref:Uncharacterized protein n=1 Tax=Domibacillus iocasae TaxID=1714016 RepID=A0A1E7DUE5_9BACI|nr:hypothetical protein [Domibacillus iocasae]OES46649.1 hypothetical protein BA724_00900 [Domibacillus iocasae]